MSMCYWGESFVSKRAKLLASNEPKRSAALAAGSPTETEMDDYNKNAFKKKNKLKFFVKDENMFSAISDILLPKREPRFGGRV